MEKTEQLLNFCCQIGRQLIQNGAEIYRVEESISRIIASYGYKDAEVFAIPAFLTINIQGDSRNYTKAARIKTSSNNMDKLDRLNALCRQVCQERPDAAEAFARLEAIAQRPAYTRWISYLAYGLAAFFFTLFWGGCMLDAGISLICGLIVKATVGHMKRMNANIFFIYVCASIFLVIVPLALSYLGCPIQMDKIVIGAIMLLVPGIAITNVMRDVIAGDFLTAITKFAEVMIVAMAIAVGIALPVGIFRIIWGVA